MVFPTKKEWHFKRKRRRRHPRENLGPGLTLRGMATYASRELGVSVHEALDITSLMFDIMVEAMHRRETLELPIGVIAPSQLLPRGSPQPNRPRRTGHYVFRPCAHILRTLNPHVRRPLCYVGLACAVPRSRRNPPSPGSAPLPNA